MNIYYVYQYLREDLTPYYIGKGKGRRAWSKDHSVSLPQNRVLINIIYNNLTEEQAHILEIDEINKWGRLDLNNGILENKSNGGEGSSGYKQSEEFKRKVSNAKKGTKNPMFGKHHSRNTKQKMSNAKKGSFTPWNKNKQLSNVIRSNMSKPKLKVVCRLIDGKEMTLSGFNKWKNSLV